MNSTSNVEENRDQARDLVLEAARLGASLAVLPEMWPFMAPEGSAPPPTEALSGPSMALLTGLARETGMWLVGGSFALKAGGGMAANACPLLDYRGNLVALYRKIHLFRLDDPTGRGLDETRFTKPGGKLVLAPTPLGTLGLSICYDLRFPELYRRLRLKGARIMAAPSAFTKQTGQAHWEILLKARAVENACVMLAAAQWGPHGGGRESHGRAMIVDPWGGILAECPPGPGVAAAEIPPDMVEQSRRRLDSTPQARLLPGSWKDRGVS